MRHSFISPVKLHVFVGSRRHQKMRMCVIQGCANLWSTSMSFLRVACDAARGLLCPKETCKRWTGWKSHYGMFFQTPEDACDQIAPLKKLSGYRALNVSRPALQIPMTTFLAFTFPRLPLTLRFRLIPLSRRRRGIWPGRRSLSLLACGHSDSQHALLVRFG